MERSADSDVVKVTKPITTDSKGLSIVAPKPFDRSQCLDRLPPARASLHPSFPHVHPSIHPSRTPCFPFADCLSLCFRFCLSAWLSPCLCLFLCFRFCLSHNSLSVSLCIFLCLCLCVGVFGCLCLSLSLSLCLSVYVCVSVPVCLCLWLSVSVSLCLCLSVSLLLRIFLNCALASARNK